MCNVLYGGGVYAATASSDAGSTASMPFGGLNALGSMTGVCWTSLPGYTSVRPGYAYVPPTGVGGSGGRTAAPSTVVDGVTYQGDWLQLDASAGFMPPSSYSIVPQLAGTLSGAPSGQPTCFVLAGSYVGGAAATDWTTLDATYASAAYKTPNAATLSTCPTTTAAWALGAPIRAIRLIVTQVSVSASPTTATIPCAICALQLFAAPAETSFAAGAGVALVTGMLGLGTAQPQQRLDVRGSAVVSGSLGVGGVASGNPLYLLQLARDSAAKPSTSTWTVFSDARLKDDVRECDYARCAEIVRQVPLSRFTWRDDVHPAEQVPDRSKLGFLAQDVQRAFPKAVEAQRAHGLDDCLSLNADQMMMALYGAVRHILLTFSP